MEFFTVPSILFLTIVAPIWIIMHYSFKSKMSKGISESDLTSIEETLATLDKLVDRVETLEEILDQQHSHWRDSDRARK